MDNLDKKTFIVGMNVKKIGKQMKILYEEDDI